MYAVAVGEMFDAIDFYGPFDEWDDAELFTANLSLNANTWIVYLEKPNA